MDIERLTYEGKITGGLRAYSAIPSSDISFYRQPGGCIEASMQNDEECDILHFCRVEEARQFLAEFAVFVDAAERTSGDR